MIITDSRRLTELRTRIDELDRDLVGLLADRTAVVREVMTLKRDAEAARSPARVEAVIARVRSLATDVGMPPDIAEATYRALIESLTQLQLRHLEQGHLTESRLEPAAEEGARSSPS